MQLLTTSDLRYLAPFAIEGAQALRLRPQIDMALEASLGQGASSLLATAVDGAGVLEWHTALPGTPVHRDNLSPEEKQNLDGRLSQAAAALQSESGRLLLSQSKDDRILGGILQNIASSIGSVTSGGWTPVSTFMVGGWPVVAGWGLVPAQAQPGEGPTPQAGAVPATQGWKGLLDGMILGKYPVKWVAAIGGGLLLFLLLILVIVIFKGNSSPAHKPGDGFVIPQGGDPDDLSFLKGCWKSDDDLGTVLDTQSANFVICLDHKGTGTLTAQEFDSAGRKIDTCSAGVTSSRDGHIVMMEVQLSQCGKGDGYQPFSLVCANGPGKTAECFGEYQDGDTFPTNLRALE
ncbi:MAG: hypothetical protein LBF40_04655 [Deltaproteobacteria bacterium]|jgi:hypothetical protein|nr:hypothetical protein [Deltaproteobacteria bacterium]